MFYQMADSLADRRLSNVFNASLNCALVAATTKLNSYYFILYWAVLDF